jgi:hypothetical protein
MLPWLGLALVALYAGYVAYDTRRIREETSIAPARPDPLIELERINTEIARLAAQSRKTLEQTRDAMQRGLRG